MKNNKPGLSDIEIKLCENIKDYATKNGYSAKEVAEYLGCSVQTVYHYYRKLIVPPVYTIYRLACLFKIPIHKLLGLPDPIK
jgi:transcriptional regulator with XRE-family HTH domain